MWIDAPLPLTVTGGRLLSRDWRGVTPASTEVAPTATVANDRVVVRMMNLAGEAVKQRMPCV